MSHQYMTDALAGVKTYLATHLETHLSAIETARSLAAGSIPRWKYLDTKLDKGKQLPSIEILPGRTARQYGGDETPYAEEHWQYHAVSLFVSVGGLEHGDVLATLAYYSEAIERAVLADYTLGALFNRVRMLEDDYLAALDSGRDGQIRQTAEIALEVRAYNG